MYLFLYQCFLNFPQPQYETYFSGIGYYLEEQGTKSCPTGSEVTDTNNCKEACTSLGISLSNSFKNDKPCFKAGNGLCKQAGNVGSKASVVCKLLGKSYSYHTQLINILLHIN